MRLPPRPRDALGRPLPRDADPSLVVEPPAERTQIDGATAWAQTGDYLAAGRPFHAHEVLEQRWRCAPADERDAWRALAQWAAARTHAARGNPAGARALAARAAAVLVTATPIPGLNRTDLDEVLADCAALARTGQPTRSDTKSPGVQPAH